MMRVFPDVALPGLFERLFGDGDRVLWLIGVVAAAVMLTAVLIFFLRKKR